MKKLKKINESKNKGITLIALVITIVVLLILAGVSIATLTGDNGILSKATDAKAKNEEATIEEEIKMALMAAKTNQLTGEQGDLAYLLGKELNESVIDKNSDGSLKLRYKQYETTITKDGTIGELIKSNTTDKDYALASIQPLGNTGKVWFMDYSSDYKFDDFLKTGVESEDELVNYVSENLNNGEPIKIEFNVEACSTISAVDQQGNGLYGRNLDLSPADTMPALIVRTNPSNGDYASISIANMGMLVDFKDGISDDATDEMKRQFVIAPYMPFDGMNEAGVSMAILALSGDTTNQNDSAKKGITTSTAVRLVLDKAGNVDEAIRLLEQYNMHTETLNYHFQIADATGKSVVVEYVNNEMKVIDDPEYAKVCTNFYLYNYIESGKEEVIDVTHPSKPRYDYAYEELRKSNFVKTEEQVMDMLNAMGYDPESTKWSVVYNSGNLTANIAPYRHYEEQDENGKPVRLRIPLFGPIDTKYFQQAK